jgi:Leucine-rich repeat (LRR) protein
VEHPVFGRIEWQAGMGWWTGRVQLDFFSVYDTFAAATCAEKLGVANWQKPPENRYQQGDFELRLISRDGREPSLWQERAFLHLLDNRDVICNLVVNVIFHLYQGNWGHWRATAEPGKEEKYADDLLIPELHSRDGLRRVIRLDALHVLDFPTNDLALIGFCFECTWDVEHGLGVLFRGGKFVEIGENYITWSAPEFAGQRGSAGAATKQQIDEQHGIAAIKKLGGSVIVEGAHPGAPGTPVVGIDLRNKQINDADLTSLRLFPSLRRLEVTSTQVTDAGLKQLQELKNLQMLQLSGTAITDAGLKELHELKNLKLLHLSGTEITDAGLKALREHKALAVLHLNDTNVTDAGLKELRALTSLQHLELSDTRVTDIGIQELNELRGLLSLDLQGTPVTDDGVKELKEFKSLRYLNLGRSKVTDIGLEQLKELKSLRTLKLQSTASSDAGVADLQRALPKLEVLR